MAQKVLSAHCQHGYDAIGVSTSVETPAPRPRRHCGMLSFVQRMNHRVWVAAALVVWPQVSAAGPVTYARDISPILNDRCVMCHSPGGSAPFSLMTYADVRQRTTLIR